MAGRYPGIMLSFEEAYKYATRNRDYWIREADGGVFVVWHGDAYLGAASTEAAAKNIIVRDLECELREVQNVRPD